MPRNSLQHCVWITFICTAALIALCCSVSEEVIERTMRRGHKKHPYVSMSRERRRNPISCLCPFTPGQRLLDHAKLLTRCTWHWTGNRARQMRGVNEALLKVASGHNETSLLAGVRPKRQMIRKRNCSAFTDSPNGCYIICIVNR